LTDGFQVFQAGTKRNMEHCCLPNCQMTSQGGFVFRISKFVQLWRQESPGASRGAWLVLRLNLNSS